MADSLRKKKNLKSELASLPAVNYVVSIYDNVKARNPVIERCFDAVETGCSVVGEQVVRLVANPADLEKTCVEYVGYAKERYPIIRKTPKGIYRKTKSRVVDWSLKKTQIVLQTAPGKVAVWGIGAASNISDKMLATVQCITNTKPAPKKGKESLGSLPNNQPSPSKKKRRNSVSDTAVTFVEYTVVFPIELTNRFLQTVHLWVHVLLADAEDKNKKDVAMSPEKAAEIRNRRKVSPRKKLKKSSVVRSWSKSAIKWLHLDYILPFFNSRSFLKNIDPSLKDTSPNKSDTEHKRKYDDIVSDSSTDNDEPSYLDQLRKLDLSQYMSDEDPDYHPADESTDTEEYEDGETESDDTSVISNTPEVLPPRKKIPVANNTSAKSNEKVEKKTSVTPKKSILKQPTLSLKEDDATKNKSKTTKAEDGKDYVQLIFKASKLDSKDIIGKSDPYLALMKQGPDGKWQTLHKTEVINNSSDPSWKPFSVPLLSLWNGDKSKQIKIVVYDKDDAVADDYVGEALVTLEDILKASKQEVTWSIINSKKQSKKKNYINSGQVHLVSCKGMIEDVKEKS